MLNFLSSTIYGIYYYILGTLAIAEDYIYRRFNKCEPIDCQRRVAVITGGARGIGAEIVKKLLQCNMTVIIGCRDVEGGQALLRRLRDSGLESGSASVFPLDLTRLSSVRDFASAVASATSHTGVHLLVNNAGIMFSPYEETEDGYESQWQVNYLGHFLLAHLLTPRLRQAAKADGRARIVNVTSCAHKAARKIRFEDINMRQGFVTQAAYAQSKTAQLMFSLRLSRSPPFPGSESVAVHPGIVDTGLFDGTLMKTLMPFAPRLLFKTAEEGAVTVLHACLRASNGDYVSNGRAAGVSNMAADERLQERLFAHTLRTLDIEEFGQ